MNYNIERGNTIITLKKVKYWGGNIGIDGIYPNGDIVEYTLNHNLHSNVIVIDNKRYPYIKSELKKQNIIGENKGYVIANSKLYPVYELTEMALSHL
ncbi:hypothetical protein KJJ36_13850 [Staphylococcus pseudoxylosus]|uniref:hypothetical protein n=1 Tax=Staphylococcus pseudoxylosus TaxID=2282419 RepID=UPI001F351258|nr:hypothetical protein [Staphylococcus pseudoxylosus]MCE5003450.1 hypothetical protein [Staphylococcus pseudoxylosus]